MSVLSMTVFRIHCDCVNLISQGVLQRQGMGFKKCPGLGPETKWSPCAKLRPN